MTTTPLVPDEVWAALDTRTARLSRRDRWGLAGAAVLVAVIGLLLALANISGLLHPSVSDVSSGIATDPATRTAVEYVRLDNGGWFDERVERVTSPSPGVTVTSIGPSPLVLPAGGIVRTTIRLRFDCVHVREGQVMLDIHLHRPWGSTTVRVGPEGRPRSSDLESVNIFMDGPAWTACGRN